jgi:membrane-associated phospholipid phosphatase
MASASYPPQSFATLRSWIKGRTFFDRRAAPVYLAIAGFCAFIVIACSFLGFEYSAQFVYQNTTAIGVFLAIALTSRWLGFSNTAGAIESWLLLLVLSVLAAFGAFIGVSANMPLVDEQLAWVDGALFGFSRSSIPRLATDWPELFGVLKIIYNTFSPQPLVLLGILFLTRHSDRAWRFLLSWSLALVICLAVAPLAPAYGTPPYTLRWIEVFEASRDGTLRLLDESVLTGIITFPSFHAAGAVLLGWGFAGIRYLRLPLLSLNVAVIVSAVMVGGHYIIDIVAGIGVGTVSIYIATKCSRPLSSHGVVVEHLQTSSTEDNQERGGL